MKLIGALALLLGLVGPGQLRPAIGQPAEIRSGNLAALVGAYPDFLDRIEGNALVWKDGTRMPIDDGRGPKDFATRLDAPDIKDMFAAPYVAGSTQTPPPFQSDPGRVRFQPLFDKMYGDCRGGDVARRLVEIDWLPAAGQRQKIKITSVNGVADRLKKVVEELRLLPQDLAKYLKPSAGTFNCRPIAGTRRISAHGHGIAIDIAVEHADYWRWTKPDTGGRLAYRNRIAWEIVEIFERHGFIWGGRWYHFDTMHFEYRPELLHGGRAPASEAAAPAR